MSDFVDNAIRANRAVVFSWTTCPYCTRAKSLLSAAAPDYRAYDMDTMPNGNAISSAIAQRYNHDTVPAVFINGQFIGGCSELEALQNSGGLAHRLAAHV